MISSGDRWSYNTVCAVFNFFAAWCVTCIWPKISRKKHSMLKHCSDIYNGY